MSANRTSTIAPFEVMTLPASVALVVAVLGPSHVLKLRNRVRMDLSRHRYFPAVAVTWLEATAVAKALGSRLPTEDEWEFLALISVGRSGPLNAVSRSSVGVPQLAPSLAHRSILSPAWPEDEYGVRGVGRVCEWTSSIGFQDYEAPLFKCGEAYGRNPATRTVQWADGFFGDLTFRCVRG